MIHYNGNQYGWVTPGSDLDGFHESRLYRSTDLWQNLTAASWAFVNAQGGGSSDIWAPCFLTAGQDYAGRFDSYFYALYMGTDGNDTYPATGGEVHLMRCSIAADPMQQANWEFFAGLDGNNNPTWTAIEGNRAPIYTDNRGVTDGISCIYYPQWDQCVACWTNGGSGTPNDNSNFHFLTARRPWGPWTTLAEFDGDWGPGAPTNFNQAFYGNFSDKWQNGADFVFVFSGVGNLDSWNTVEGSFVLSTP